MEIQDYLTSKKEFHELLLNFLDCEEDEYEDSYLKLNKYIQITKFIEDRTELREFILLVLIISNNHHREHAFYKKIEQILLPIKSKI